LAIVTRSAQKTRFLLMLNLCIQRLACDLLASLRKVSFSLFASIPTAESGLIYALRHRGEAMVANALATLAAVYTCHTGISVLGLWSR
jgi:hypothetical protein